VKTTDKSTKIAKITALGTTKAHAGTKDTTQATTTRFRDAMNTMGLIIPIGPKGWGPALRRKLDSGG
jgi:hypothetical protein